MGSPVLHFGLLKAPELQRLSVTVEVLRVGVMIVGVISVGVMTVGVLCVGVMTLSSRYWKILENTGNTSIVYNTGNTSIAAGCFIISRFRSYELKRVMVRVMVFSATFNNISVILWHSVLMAVLTKANPDIFQLQVIAICKKSKD